MKARLHKYPTKKAKEAFAHLLGRKTVAPMRLAEVFAGDIVQERGKIEQEIAAGFVVICDRYLHSTLAYQGVGAGFGKVGKMIAGLEALVPDLVILLDMDANQSAGRKRAQKRLGRLESDLLF
ncbi:Thymidylate kinase [uncultured archaeon]|nr:Thymidylate kinase [uncultured archaeon]